jgi:mono/diheme cytochrome c family protein
MMSFLLACDGPPSPAGAVTWSAKDHDHAELSGQSPGNPSNGKQGPRLEATAEGTAGGGAGPRALGELVWMQQCARCHGSAGKGDGPGGPATNLSLPDVQARLSDAQVAEVIRGGKGRMPAFADLPPDVVTELVRKVRSFK